MITFGEGLGVLQADKKRSQMLRDAINDVWYENQKNIAEECGCE